MDDGPVDRARNARLVPRRVGRDDGRDDVPVTRADGRALLAHDEATAGRAAAVHRRLPRDVGRRRRGRVRHRAGRWPRSPATCSPGTARGAGWPARRCSSAAVYELTPLKDVCLRKCRSPLGFLLGAWRDGRTGSLRMGARHGAWCVGCCWALMASLFALGVMSIAWMAFVAALIAAEKTLPWRRVAVYGTGVLLLALGLAAVRRARCDPGLTTPDRRCRTCNRWAHSRGMGA